MYAEPRSVWINGANPPSLTLACSNTLIAPLAVSVGVINQLTGYCPYRSKILRVAEPYCVESHTLTQLYP